MASNEHNTCPMCGADTEHRKTVILKDGCTMKKVWLCKTCMLMYVTVTTVVEEDTNV